MDHLEIRELTPERVEDYLAFFDQVAFTDNPGWAHCYCAFFHRDYPDEDSTPPELPAQNRAFRVEQIRSGQAPGFLAFANGQVVGWCNAGPRAAYQNLRHLAAAVDNLSESVGAVLCFVIAPSYRNQGVATALLDAACQKFARDGLAMAEGYPAVKFPELPYELALTARNHCGPLAMFLNQGFTIHRSMGNWAVVRKPLSQHQE